MKCPKCNSENIQIQAKEYKPKITFPCCLTFGGFGLMFLGIVGLIIGVIVGLLVSALLYAIIPTAYQSVMVCQQCGFVGTDKNVPHIAPNSLFCAPNESNFLIIRKSNSFGNICRLRVRVDNFDAFEISDGEVKHLLLERGEHTLIYEQANGMGKKQRQGMTKIVVGENESVQFEFQRIGINVIVQ